MRFLCLIKSVGYFGRLNAFRNSRRANAINAVVLVVLIMYPSLGADSLEMLHCEVVAGGHYLSSDFRVKCWEGEHVVASAVAWFAIAVYVVGIPSLLAYALSVTLDGTSTLDVRRSLRLSSRLALKESEIMFGSLYRSYKPKYYYYEVVEMFRKLMLTGVLAFVPSGSSAQLLFGIMICLAHVIFISTCMPFASTLNNYGAQATSYQLVLTMLIGIVYKLDSSREGAGERALLSVLLSLMYLSVLILGVALLFVNTAKISDLCARFGIGSRGRVEVVPRDGDGDGEVDEDGGWMLEKEADFGDAALGGEGDGDAFPAEESRAAAQVEVGHEQEDREQYQDQAGHQEQHQHQQEQQHQDETGHHKQQQQQRQQQQQQQQQQVQQQHQDESHHQHQQQQQQLHQQQQQQQLHQQQQQLWAPPNVCADLDQAIIQLRQNIDGAFGATPQQSRQLRSLHEQRHLVQQVWSMRMEGKQNAQRLASLRNQVGSRPASPAEAEQLAQLEQALHRLTR